MLCVGEYVILLSAYCKVARLKCPEASYIVGFATYIDTKGASEDLILLDVREWTPKKQEEAARLQKEHGLLLDEKIKKTVGRTLEWPEVKEDLADKPHSSGLNRKQRRRLEKNRRRKKKKINLDIQITLQHAVSISSARTPLQET